MAQQLMEQMNNPQMTPPPMDQNWSGGLQPNEPRWDETRYSQPSPYQSQQQTWEMPPQQNWNPGMPIPGMGGGMPGLPF